MKTVHLGIAVLAATLMSLNPARPADRTEVTFPGDHAYPESLSATSDGTIYAGSLMRVGFFAYCPGRRLRSSGSSRERTIR
jgi:hypothetical protein